MYQKLSLEPVVHIVAVDGISCGKCVAKIEAALAEFSGVNHVVVSPDHTVEVSGSVSLALLQSELQRLGYPPRLEHHAASSDNQVFTEQLHLNGSPDLDESSLYELQITGMSCASCVKSVEQALLSLPEVSTASVNFAAETALVRSSGNVKNLFNKLAQVGYGAQLATEAGCDHTTAIKLGYAKAAVALTGGTVLMLAMKISLLPDLAQNQSFWILAGFIIAAVMYLAGGSFYARAIKSAQHYTATMDTLIAIGTGVAWLYSMWVILVPETVPESGRFLFFEAALFVIGFVNLGKTFELKARSASSNEIQALLALAPKQVVRLEYSTEHDQYANDELIDISKVLVGDFIRVLPGEAVPVDGVIVEGNASVDESMVTGESISKEYAAGARLRAGTMNLFGSFVMSADQVGSDTSLAKMIELVKTAQNSKPPIARLADKIASIFVPVVLFIALATAIYWTLTVGVSVALLTAMSVLVIACPCALGLAIPISVMVGMGRGASIGLIIKNTDALQAMAKVDIVVLDKTGTLTQGKPEVVAVHACGENHDAEITLLSYAYAIERHSEHPLALSVCRYGASKDLTLLPVEQTRAYPGGGISGMLDGYSLLVGNEAFLRSQTVHVPENRVNTNVDQAAPSTEVLVAYKDEYIGSISFADSLRAEAVGLVSQLKKMAIEVHLVSGDNQAVTAAVAVKLGIDCFQGETMPEGKLRYVQALQSKAKVVAMVGDGINDAPALAAANIGVAMGEGTDVALESADIAIASDRLSRLSAAVVLSRQTMANIYQNLFAAFAYNIILIPLAAGVAYPTLINPAYAGLAMALSSVSVVLNASRMRLLRLA